MIRQDIFPVIYSTLAPKALVRDVLSEYNIESVTNCRLWQRGLSDIYI